MVSGLQKNLFLVFNAFISILVILLIVRGPISEHTTEHTVEPPVVTTNPTPTTTIVVREEKKEEVLEKPKEPELFEYVQVTSGCKSNFQGTCINVRTAPSSTSSVAYKLRNGVVLKVRDKVTVDGRDWYRIYFNEWLRYPERVAPNLYVAAELVTSFYDEGDKGLENNSSSTKRIVVDRSKQLLYAYDGDVLFMKEKVSTGIELTPTPRGTFTIYKKTPSRYMQGPIPGISNHYYDLPGVPWNLYFSKEGAVIHGAYWHTSFGKRWSNGCVNLPLESAEKLYKWAEVGTKVLVRD